MAEATEPIEADDTDEQELIASGGDSVVPAVAPKDEDEDDEPEATAETPVEAEAAPADTAPAGDGTDTVGGGSGGAEPVSTPVPPAPVTPAPLPPDDMDRRFDAAIAKIDADDILTDGQKEAYKLQLESQREQRNERRYAAQETAEDNFRNKEARRLGITRDVLDSEWATACTESVKLQGNALAAHALMNQRIAALKGKPANGHPAPAATAKKPVIPPTPITPKGARVAPPAASVPAPKRELTDEEELVESVRQERKAGVRP